MVHVNSIQLHSSICMPIMPIILLAYMLCSHACKLCVVKPILSKHMKSTVRLRTVWHMLNMSSTACHKYKSGVMFGVSTTPNQSIHI